jgi:hypothetical protein
LRDKLVNLGFELTGTSANELASLMAVDAAS